MFFSEKFRIIIVLKGRKKTGEQIQLTGLQGVLTGGMYGHTWIFYKFRK